MDRFARVSRALELAFENLPLLLGNHGPPRRWSSQKRRGKRESRKKEKQALLSAGCIPERQRKKENEEMRDKARETELRNF